MPSPVGAVAVLSAAALAVLGAPAQATAASPAPKVVAASDSSTAPTYQSTCAVAKPGTFSCFALRRTDGKQPAHAQTSATAPAGYGPADLQSAYSLPSDGGSGQTVAIVDAYDDPTAEADLAVYRQQYGLPACTSANGCFSKVDQTGGTQYPPANGGWDGEISLDLDMVSAAAPNAHILLVEATDDSEDNLGAAVDEAVALGAEFVSNSYGSTYTSTPGSGEDPSETTTKAPRTGCRRSAPARTARWPAPSPAGTATSRSSEPPSVTGPMSRTPMHRAVTRSRCLPGAVTSLSPRSDT